jgi:Uma2 family endonuclease
MATGTLISVEEYLKTVYRPDCDYVAGLVEERNMGEFDHGLVQTRLAYFLMSLYKQTGLLPVTELRMRVRQNKYRIPDVVVIQNRPGGKVLTEPPLLCIEILSSEDRLSRMNTRVQEYLEFGVPVVWVVDPAEKTIWIYRKSGMQEATGASIKLDGTSIEIPFSEIFD